MKLKKLVIATFVTLSILLIGSTTFASPSANILYQETDIGGGLWEYEYILYNESTTDKYLRGFVLNYYDGAPITTMPTRLVPAGWFLTFAITSYSPSYSTLTFAEATTGIDQSYDMLPGNYLGGFFITIDHQVGSLPFTAYFSDHETSESYEMSGNTLLVPEPISSILFVAGGTLLAGRRYIKRKKKA